MGTFRIDKTQFLLNDKPFRILSGAMHYFRVMPEYWLDRMQKMKNMGLNTLETYVAWNLHESKPRKYNFKGWLDLVKYIQIAGDLGLQVIVRPGPYICSEWDLGGLPAWLLKDPGMRLRCHYQPYLDAIDRFFDKLIPQLAPLQITKAGPIILFQVENEYGSYGNDKKYLQHLADGLLSRDIDVPLFTSDGPFDACLGAGTLPQIFKTGNFGSKADSAFSKLREYQKDGPLMCAEFWNGWFDHWGEKHHTRPAEEAAEALDQILSKGASVNLYMFHGGTNFGFMNGANCDEKYQPTVNSYDDDAPLNEAGEPTPKYFALREVIGKYQTLPDIPVFKHSPKMTLENVELTESIGLFESLDQLSAPVISANPEPMENFGQNYGFILYRTEIIGPRGEMQLNIRELHDRAHVFLDGKLLGILEREFPENKISFAVPNGKSKLEILVENMGRTNFGSNLHDRKGITEAVFHGGLNLFNWEIFPLPLDNLKKLKFSSTNASECPAFFRGIFKVEYPQDTFLHLPAWTKGVCFLNGFNLSRYWNRGPQKSLYVPAPLLKKGQNELIVFELHGSSSKTVEFRDQPDLG